MALCNFHVRTHFPDYILGIAKFACNLALGHVHSKTSFPHKTTAAHFRRPQQCHELFDPVFVLLLLRTNFEFFFAGGGTDEAEAEPEEPLLLLLLPCAGTVVAEPLPEELLS